MRPGSDYVGHYVKVIHDFHTDFPGEVNLAKGDVFKVTKVIDKNWLQGTSKDKQGNFPADFVEKLTIPVTEEGQKIFAAVENFPAQQDGDLEFRKGAIIVGLSPIDEFWWQGQNGRSVGMFPITHVMELEVSGLLKQRSRSVHATETLFAQALVDSKAQLDEELSFQAGDIITVTEVIDEDWYTGQCRGKSGMFLASCVQLLNEEECNESGVRDKPSQTTPNKVPTDSFIKNNQLNHQSNPVITAPSLSQSHNGDSNVSSVNNSNLPPAESNVFTSENTKAHQTDSEAGVTPYARTLYAFTGELSDEISFEANDIVTLIQHVDEQWIEGEIDGKIGLFPSNYVDIVVDCPYAFSRDGTEEAENGPEENIQSVQESCETDKITPADSNAQRTADDNVPSVSVTEFASQSDHDDEQYALVLYSFHAEKDSDITVIEGETVTVVKRLDENWIAVKNDNGKTGMCPAAYVEIVGGTPLCSSKIHDNNDNEIKTAIDKDAQTAKQFSHPQSKEGSPLKNRQSLDLHKSSSNPQHSEKGQSASAIRRSLDSGVSASSKSADSSKPQIKQKPSLAPKPALKPKPALSAKPFTNTGSLRKPVSFDEAPGIPKSSSSHSFVQSVSKSNEDDQSGVMTKAQSMFEINHQPEPVSDSTLQKNTDCSSNSGSTGSLTQSGDRRMSTDSGKKAFEDWDLTKPLDSLLHDEFAKAAHATDARSRSVSGTSRSSGSFASETQSTGAARSSFSQGNYCRDNFESAINDGVSVGNSTFFVNEQTSAITGQQKSRYGRKPPPPPTMKGGAEDFTRRPSLKKPAPPRPKGPRIPPAPSRTPLVPVRSDPLKVSPGSAQQVQSGSAAPARPGRIPSRPKSGAHRPAPPRPQVTPSKSGSDLMSFSPTNSSLYLAEDGASEEKEELRTRITGLEADIQDCERSRAELEQMQTHVDGEDTEIHDNIQFYTDNINGLKAELCSLREQLAGLCPTERNKIDQERLVAERKEAEARLREEQKKQREIERMERREKRERVIEELVQTEKDFLASLSLIMETFLTPQPDKPKEVEEDLLCGNVEEVAEVSQKLLTSLEEATHGKDFSQQVIGTCFVVLAEDMKNVYAPYCRNHDNVITLIEKYNQNPEIKAYFDRLLDKLREQHVVFDLEALLIKPVQRILKYPLLLNELYKSTEEDHLDKAETLKAINAMTNVAQAINEYKRRKDLVYKYKKDSDVSLGDKLSKLSLHSIKKKSSRIKERFSVNLGFIDQTRDANFDREETRYRQTERMVRIFIRDVQVYMDDMQNLVGIQDSLSADIDDYYGDKLDPPEVNRYLDLQNSVQKMFMPNFQKQPFSNLKQEVDEMVTLPMSQLSQMFDAPNKVIQKRYDKLLDYDNMNRKAQNDKTFEKPMQLAKKNYEALNAQLLDELPRLVSLAMQLFRDCVASFVCAQRVFTHRVLQEMYTVLELQVLSDQNVIEQFNIQHTSVVDRLALLSFMPRAFSPRVADQKQEKKAKRMSIDPTAAKSTEAVPQLDSQRVMVIQQYAASKLFRVTETHVAMDTMELSICEGDIVGVVMEKDPMGNRDRWFVDNGATKGFLSKKLLCPYESSPSRPQSGSSQLLTPEPVRASQSELHSPTNHRTSVLFPTTEEMDDMDFGLEEEMVPDLTDCPDPGPQSHLGTSPHQQGHSGYQTDAMLYGQQTESQHAGAMENQEDDIQLFYAEYAFSARNENEVTLFEHQVVTVIAPHDQNGNPEWWYVEADGVYGYAPAAYLRPMDSHGDPT